jgi:hypothetical protein
MIEDEVVVVCIVVIGMAAVDVDFNANVDAVCVGEIFTRNKTIQLSNIIDKNVLT